MPPSFASILLALLAACAQVRETPIGIGTSERCTRPMEKLYMDTYLVTLYAPEPGANTCSCPTNACRTIETRCLTGAEIEASAAGLQQGLRGVRLDEFDPETPSCIRVVGLSLGGAASDPATCENAVESGLAKPIPEHAGRICARMSKPAEGTLGIALDQVACVSPNDGYQRCVGEP